jgi:aspartate 1-decarboxylase
MKVTMLKSKLHKARVTDRHLDYEGSTTIDRALLEEVGILPHEQIQIYNMSNGNRFETYAIVGERGSGDMVINGAAAHKASTGDLIIVACFVHVEAQEAANHKPSMVYVDADNAIVEVRRGMETANIAAIV